MSQSNYTKPLIFNTYKPKDISSYDVVRHFKRNLPKGFGKIGHFGTLDPFASGVLMIGVNGAAKLNDFIHDLLPKTYIATGILGLETATGDMTEEVTQKDESRYLNEVISLFDIAFIEEKLKENFQGEYFQAPHQYSAAKFEGKALHKWAREGVKIEKEKKRRFIHDIKVLSYSFPELEIEFTVSSGTYIRTLFSDCARHLGTIGTLKDLERTAVGSCHKKNTLEKEAWAKEQELLILNKGLDVREVLPFGKITFADKEARLYSNGVQLNKDRAKEIKLTGFNHSYFWVENDKEDLLGLARIEEDKIKTQCNF